MAGRKQMQKSIRHHNSKKKRQSKRTAYIAVFALVAAFAAVIALIVSLDGSRLNLKINDTLVEKDEYLRIMDENIYEVTQYFTEKYHAGVDKAFWGKEFGGEVPSRMLADKTIEDLKYFRGVYENAREKGYVDSMQYRDLVKRFENENAARKEKISKGEAVYGLSEFTLPLFIEYEMDVIQKNYCDNLENPGMQITEEERQTYYEENKNSIFIKDDDIELEFVRIPYEQDGLSDQETEELKQAMTAMYKEATSETGLESLLGSYENLRSYFASQKILSGERSGYDNLIGDVLELAGELKKGEYSQVIDEYGTLYLIFCKDRVDYDYQSISEVTDVINKNLREEHYDGIIREKAETSVVEGKIEDVYQFTLKQVVK